MEQDQNFASSTNQSGFGMTEEEIKNARIKNFFSTVKYYLQKIEPVFVKIFNVTFYYLIRFIKSFVTYAFQMIKGGGS